MQDLIRPDASFTPRELFSRMQGAWFEPPNLQLGPELIRSLSSGWTNTTTFNYTSGSITFAGAGSTQFSTKSDALTPGYSGKLVRMQITCSSYTGSSNCGIDNNCLYVEPSFTTAVDVRISAVGVYEFSGYWRGSAGNESALSVFGRSTNTYTLSNISVREIIYVTPSRAWQENTGATATTSGGQTIGLLLGLDQQQRLVSEIIVDGQFANAGASWVLSAGVTANVGAMTFPSTTTFTESISQSNAVFAANNVYQLQINGTGTVAYRMGTSDVNTIITLPFSGIFSRASYANRRMQIFNVSGSAAVINSVSCRQVLGNHASQATAANRPTLQYNGNLPLIRHDSTDVLTASLPNLGSGVFSSAGSVYFATPSGMSCLHNQSIGTSYNLPALQTDNYCTVITPARLAPPLEQRLALYMHRLAGLSDADFFWQEDYGPELVINGSFDFDVTGWTATNGIIAWSAGALVATPAATTETSVYRTFSATVGRQYLVTADLVSVGSGSTHAYCQVGTSFSGVARSNHGASNTVATPGKKSFITLPATTTTLFVQIANVGTLSPSVWDNISVREVLDGQVGQLLADDNDTILLRA